MSKPMPHLPILPPQAATAVTGDSLEWWKLAGAAVFGALASFIAFRTKLYGLDRDIRELRAEGKASEKRIADQLERIEQRITEGRTDGTVAVSRDALNTREALNAIRRDNDKHHAENLQRLRIVREQLLALVRLITLVARKVPGLDQTEVDKATVNFMELEVERAD